MAETRRCPASRLRDPEALVLSAAGLLTCIAGVAIGEPELTQTGVMVGLVAWLGQRIRR